MFHLIFIHGLITRPGKNFALKGKKILECLLNAVHQKIDI